MTVQEMLDELDDHGFTDTSVTRKLAFLNDTYYDVCAREPWPFLEYEANSTLASGGDTLTLPTDWSKTQTITLYRSDGSGFTLAHERADVIQKMYPANSTSTPSYFYIIGDSMYVYPDADAAYTVNHIYIRKPIRLLQSDPESTIIVPVNHHRAILLGALSKLYVMEDDTDLGAVFDSQYERRIEHMRNDLWKQQYDTPERIWVLDVDDSYDDF